MDKKAIRLGCEVEDITAKVRGIAVGHVKYLDGSECWIVQPPYGDDGNRVATVEVQDAYAVRTGEGVHAAPKKATIGFSARGEY